VEPVLPGTVLPGTTPYYHWLVESEILEQIDHFSAKSNQVSHAAFKMFLLFSLLCTEFMAVCSAPEVIFKIAKKSVPAIIRYSMQ
jgi:hypothetical protein